VAVAPHQRPFARLQADGVQHLLAQAQVVQLAHGIGLQVDAHAQRLECGHGFEHLARHADLVQRQGQRHAADAAAGDENGAGVIQVCHQTDCPRRPSQEGNEATDPSAACRALAP